MSPSHALRPRVFSILAALAFTLLAVLALVRPASAQAPLRFGVLHSFGGTDPSTGNPDGTAPYSGLTPGGDGYLYGVDLQGGTSGNGTVFKVRLDGTGYQTLHSFSATSSAAPFGNSDGTNPFGALLPGGDGFFYGTAEHGGTSGNGTLFKIRADGSGFAVLHDFSALDSNSDSADGGKPFNGLTNGGDGFFYGVTEQGGANSGGTVFRVNSDGSVFNTLHSFNTPSDGDRADGALAVSGSSLYGVTSNGGTNGTGTIFRLQTDGGSFLVLHAFSGRDSSSHNADGAISDNGLTLGPGGLLYGMATVGGTSGSGTVFKLQTDGSGFTVIHNFSALDSNSDNADGAFPQYDNVTIGPDGLLYGEASGGGTGGGNGTVFKLQTDGSAFQTLHSFSGTEGGDPNGTPVFAADGFLYGQALSGGINGSGTLFRLTPVHTHLLWDTADGRVSLWTIDTLGHITYSPTYGPYDSGKWKAMALATGPDGRSHLLWAHPSDGTYSVWDITNPASPMILPTYGPYTGWSATALTVGSDGQDRLLWNDSQPFTFGKTSTGPVSLWTLNSAGSFSYQLYGPYDLWSAAAVASSEAGVSHLLWHNTGGQASLWAIDGGGNISISPTYGPYPGWQTISLAVGLQGERELLWNHASDGMASLWRVSATGHSQISPSYGPYPGYSCVAVTADPAGGTDLLWSHPSDGMAAFWALDGASDAPGIGASTQSVYGPYPDGHSHFWFPVAASAGP